MPNPPVKRATHPQPWSTRFVLPAFCATDARWHGSNQDTIGRLPDTTPPADGRPSGCSPRMHLRDIHPAEASPLHASRWSVSPRGPATKSLRKFTPLEPAELASTSPTPFDATHRFRPHDEAFATASYMSPTASSEKWNVKFIRPSLDLTSRRYSAHTRNGKGGDARPATARLAVVNETGSPRWSKRHLRPGTVGSTDRPNFSTLKPQPPDPNSPPPKSARGLAYDQIAKGAAAPDSSYKGRYGTWNSGGGRKARDLIGRSAVSTLHEPYR